jgi:uncharacterized protein
MQLPHFAEWEWSWKTPLLLHFPNSAPPQILDFLEKPLEEIALGEAEASLEERLSTLKSSRIGIRFERIQEALIRAHPETESLRTGLVIPNRTEVDLLHRIHTLTDTLIHWEVAVKFYIGLDAGGADTADRFIGPSLKDTLGIKMRTIFGRQLAILHDSEVREKYGEAFGIRSTDSIISLPKVHGILYLPYENLEETRQPPGVSEKGQRGAWMTIDALSAFVSLQLEKDATASLRWMVERREWIRDQAFVEAPAELEIDLKLFLNSPLEARIQSYFAGNDEPIHCALVTGKPGPKKDALRFFIVPNHWPDAAERALETLKGQSRIKV